MQTNIAHKFVRNTKSEIDKKPIENGSIYFSTDTEEILMDNEEGRKTYGASAIEKEQIYKNKENYEQLLQAQSELINDNEIKKNKVWSSEKTNDSIINVSMKATAEGNPIKITDNLEYHPFEYEMYGESKQNPIETLTGDIIVAENSQNDQSVICKVENKNLIPDIAINTNNLYGVNFTINDNGTITTTGTAKKTVLMQIGKTFTVSKKGRYCVSGCADGGSSNTYVNSIIYRVNGEVSYSNDIGKGSFKDLDVGDTITMYIKILEGQDGNHTWYPSIVISDVKPPFTPHISDLSAVKVSRVNNNYCYADFKPNNNEIVNPGLTTTIRKNHFHLKGNTSKLLQYVKITIAMDRKTTLKGHKVYIRASKPLPFDMSYFFRNSTGKQTGVTLKRGTTNNWSRINNNYESQDVTIYGFDENSDIDVEFDLQISIDKDYETIVEPVSDQIITPSPDGTVKGMTSVSPTTTILTDNPNVNIIATIAQPIVSDVTEGVESGGKNLISYPYKNTTITTNGITFTDNKDGTITINGTATNRAEFILKSWGICDIKKGMYVFSTNIPNFTSESFVNIAFRTKADEKFFDKVYRKPVNEIVLEKDADFLYIALVITKGDSFNKVRLKPKLELGSSATPYTPYHHKSYPFNLPVELRGIGEDKDRLYLDSDGLWKVERNIGSNVYDGSPDEKWEKQEFGNPKDKIRFGILVSDIKPPTSDEIAEKGYCNLCRFAPVAEQWVGKESIIIGISKKVFIYDESISTLSDWIAFLKKHNLSIVYLLATPTIEILPDDVQKQLNQFMVDNLVQGDVVIDSGTHQSIKYIADSAKHVEDKFNYLQNEITSLHPNSWNIVKNNLSLGKREELYPIGKQFTETHKEYGDMQLEINDYDNIEVVNDTNDHIGLEMKNCIYGMEFDREEFLYYAEEELPIGDYSFMCTKGYEESDSKDLGGGKRYTFKLSKPVPKGGGFRLAWGYGKNVVDSNIVTYSDRFLTTTVETVKVALGSTGTDLGITDGSDKLNNVNRNRYGNANYAQSNIRQYLNATGVDWWKPQTKWDTAPRYYNKEGFLGGFSQDFIDSLLTTRRKYSTNQIYETGYEKNSFYELEDKIFLLSMTELGFGNNNNVAEGKVLDKYVGATNADRVKTDSNGVAKYWWQASCIPWLSCNSRNVIPDGSLNHNSAYIGNGLLAACVI